MADDDAGKPAFNLTFSGVRVVITPADHYLDADWHTVVLSPLWVYEAITTADKAGDEKEKAAFVSMLERPPAGVFTAFVFAHVRKNLDALLAARARDPRTPLAGIADVETLLAGYPHPTQAAEFRRALIDLAHTVASASGRGLFGLGPKVSEAEQAVIAQLRATLHVAS